MPPDTIRISGFHGVETLRIERAPDRGLVLTGRDAIAIGEFLVQPPVAKKKPKAKKAPRPRRTLLETLRAHPRVEFADDLRACGDGIFVTLREGFSFEDDDDARCRGEDTVTEALRQVRHYSEPYAGPYHD